MYMFCSIHQDLPLPNGTCSIRQRTSPRAPIKKLLGKLLLYVINTSRKKSWCHMFEYALALGVLVGNQGNVTTKSPTLVRLSNQVAIR